MKRLGQDEHPIRLGFIGAALTLIYLAVLLPWGLLEGARLQSYDAFCRWRNLHQPAPEALEQIALVTIDEESQRKLGKKWPWNRSVYADFLRRVSGAGPQMVLFDLVLSGASETEHDQTLARAIQAAPPVLLAAYHDRKGGPVFPLPLFTEAGAEIGLIDKPRDVDLRVRRLWAAMRVPLEPEPLYAIEIKAAALARGIHRKEIRLDRGIRFGEHTVPLEPPGAMAINYFAPPERIPTLSFWEIMQDPARAVRLAGKIVLVGTATEITHDTYPTPLGVIPGVTISANALVTLLSGRFPRPLPMPMTLLAGFLAVYGILLATYKLPAAKSFGVAAGMASLGVLAAVAAVLFLDYKAECLSVFILCLTAWVVGLFYRYALLVAETFQLHRTVATDPVSGVMTCRYFRLKLQSAGQGAGRRRAACLLVLHCNRICALLQQLSWDAARARVRAAAEILESQKPRGAFVGQLEDGKFAIFAPRMRPEAARKWAETTVAALQSQCEGIAAGLVCSDQQPSASPPQLLQFAEAAAARAQTRKTAFELFDPAQDRPSTPAKGREGAAQPEGRVAYIASELEERNRALEQALSELRQAHQQMAGQFLEVTKSLVIAMETKDEYTAGHLERVSRYATRLAEEVGLPKAQVEAIREAALLHDIGKMHLPDEVLHKIGPLTEEDRKVLQKHLELGAKILEPMKFFKPITSILYHHHERYDGKGYPHGLTGELIPPGAQIITVVDSFDAMTTNRGYNKPKTTEEALEELRRGAGTQFNPAYVEKFVDLIQREGPQLAGYQAAPS